MNISAITTKPQNFGAILGDGNMKPSNTTLLLQTGGNIGSDSFHPVNVFVKFHDNGQLASLDLKYKNGKYSEGSIHEEYDEDGKNINLNA